MRSLLLATPTRRALRPVVDRIDERIERALRRQARGQKPAATREELAAVRAELAALRAERQQLGDRLRRAEERLYAVDLLLGRDGRGAADRVPPKPQIMELCRQITAVTGLAKPYAQVAFAYRTLVELELRGVGRLAGSTANILGKLTTTPLLAPAGGSVLEIGTLYGLFSGGLARQLARHGREYDLTIVDPLADVQLQPDRAVFGSDPSGSPVSETVARTNLALAGVAPERLRLQRGFSTDPEVREAVSDRRYGVVVIDGDHSEEGVRKHLAWAEEITAPGGVVVMDDYGDAGWPGVQAALDGHLAAGGSRFTLLGTVSTSAFLRADAE
jgi:hypothetical protein